MKYFSSFLFFLALTASQVSFAANDRFFIRSELNNVTGTMIVSGNTPGTWTPVNNAHWSTVIPDSARHFQKDPRFYACKKFFPNSTGIIKLSDPNIIECLTGASNSAYVNVQTPKPPVMGSDEQTVNTVGNTEPIPTGDPTPRISIWPGKVAQHIDADGIWRTDADGRSGGGDDLTSYCNKFFAGTIGFREYKNETIATWHDAGNRNNYYREHMSYECIIGTPPALPTTAEAPAELTPDAVEALENEVVDVVEPVEEKPAEIENIPTKVEIDEIPDNVKPMPVGSTVNRSYNHNIRYVQIFQMLSRVW